MQPNILENFLGQARITKLSEEDRLSCEGLITIEECVKALNTFEKGIFYEGGNLSGSRQLI